VERRLQWSVTEWFVVPESKRWAGFAQQFSVCLCWHLVDQLCGFPFDIVFCTSSGPDSPLPHEQREIPSLSLAHCAFRVDIWRFQLSHSVGILELEVRRSSHILDTRGGGVSRLE
jgi:hypothetical protein